MKRLASAALVCGQLFIGMTGHAEDEGKSGWRYSLPLKVALDAAQEALRVCEQKHYWVTATVVDMDGVPQLVLRGDKATVHTAESSFRKAFTVVTLGPEFGFDRSSGFFELMKTSPYAPQLATVHNVMALPGAVAFKVNGEMIGALGIGGAPGGDKDEVCAAAGVAKVANELPH
ncbi:heme-binding protein [Caballeronia sp. LZ035]|uniref:GlcG/HbpS family heme-binding protein n=1 Tax=Caballeronia sp. LZ035 TaxID=3038568 RepID=UPI002858E27B|nr:heme-binding protein [Caballeronia sp. LZ035]MDR5761233.1 heme-binding protein [Caballeronia sp. LZ035]